MLKDGWTNAVAALRHRRTRLYAGRLLLLCTALAVALGLVEYTLRLAHPDKTFGVTQEMWWLRNADQHMGFTVDQAVGFRPVFDETHYNHYGTQVNDYVAGARNNRKRLLFIGDSVTARGLIVQELRKLYGETAYEYWNAGVESYNTEQELNYYLAYNQKIRPDHVILQFHLNDFELTPAVFRNEAGELEVHAPQTRIRGASGWLFGKSYLYRCWVGHQLSKKAGGREEIIAATRENMSRFKEILDREGIQFTVVVQPIMMAPEKWWKVDQESHALILALLREKGIRHFDLAVPLRQAIGAGVNVTGTPPDKWHPDRTMAGYFARYLKQKGML